MGPQLSCTKVTLETVRKTLEMVRPSFIYGLEESSPKDHIHQRGSGFNHILARLAHDKNTAIAFSLASLHSPTKRPQILGRISQNIAICRKYAVRTHIASFATEPAHMRGPHDIASLFALLGMHPTEIKNSFN
jgi:RNase P/RNase MRP subunit p30